MKLYLNKNLIPIPHRILDPTILLSIFIFLNAFTCLGAKINNRNTTGNLDSSYIKHTLSLKLTTKDNNVLIFRDEPSWNRKQTYEATLNLLNIKHDVKLSSEMDSTELSGYDFIIIPGAQWNSIFYALFAKNSSKFDQYVKGGGTLVVEMNGAENHGMTLPGGVKIISHGVLKNVVNITNHPILSPLAGKPLITAQYASHGYLENAPSGSLLLAAELIKNTSSPDLTKPTFVEYEHGLGRVIAGAQCFHDRDGSGRGPLMATLLVYAANRQWFSTVTTPIK